MKLKGEDLETFTRRAETERPEAEIGSVTGNPEAEPGHPEDATEEAAEKVREKMSEPRTQTPDGGYQPDYLLD